MATGTLIPFVFSQVFDNDGDPAAGMNLWIYDAGTTDLASSWSDASLTTPNTNPISLNAAARFNCFLASGTYDFYLALASDVGVPPTSPIATSLGVTVVSQGESNVFTILGDSTGNIAADTLVYMSDGTSGTAGYWYTADSGAVASSSGARLFGWTTTAIGPANAPGLIQIFGSITIPTLSFASGADVYVSTGGTATDTPPANQRWIGKMTDVQTMFMNGFGDPPASSSLAGLVTTQTQSFAGNKTFDDDVTITGTATLGTPVFSALPTGVGATVFSRAASDTTKNNNATLVDVTGLSFSVLANTTYVFDFVIHFITPAGANLKYTLTGPASPTGVRFGTTTVTGSGTGDPTDTNAFATTLAMTVTATVDRMFIVKGLLRNGANAGTVQFQFAQNSTVIGDTIVYADSYVTSMRLT